jgi:hypothetical protein
MSNGSSESREIGFRDVVCPDHEASLPIAPRRQIRADSPWSYEMRRGQRPFKLNGLWPRLISYDQGESFSSCPQSLTTPLRRAASRRP